MESFKHKIFNLIIFLQILAVIVLIGTCSADYKAGGGGATKSAKPIQYAGPIVYTDERPPVIHFPPPPRPQVNYFDNIYKVYCLFFNINFNSLFCFSASPFEKNETFCFKNINFNKKDVD